MSSRGEKLVRKIDLIADALDYARAREIDLPRETERYVVSVRRAFDQGSWTRAEQMLRNNPLATCSWFQQFKEMRDQALRRTGSPRFRGDGLCGRYGHSWVKVTISQRRWFYRCTYCNKEKGYSRV